MDNENTALTGSELKKAHRDIDSAFTSLSRSYYTATEKKTAVVACEKKCAGALTQKELDKIDIDEINRTKQGFRVQLLRENGINTVGDLLGWSESRLVRINGIGTEGAKKLKKAALEIQDTLSQQTWVALDAGSLDNDQKQLVKALYEYIQFEGEYEDAIGLYLKTFKDIKAANEKIKPALSGLGRLFASGDKKREAQAAAEYISALWRSDFIPRTQAIGSALSKKTFPTVSEAVRDFEQNSAKYYAVLEYITGKKAGSGKVAGGLSEEESREIENIPLDITGLKCTLRSYQAFGAKFILKQGNVLLGDEMGLGKTVEAIAVMTAVRNSGKTHFMVVCPASVLVNWCREIEKHSDLKSRKLHGNDAQLSEWIEEGGVAVTTYESCTKYDIPDSVRVSVLTVDEAHYVKNPQARRTKAVLALASRADRVLYMTGTPLENNVDEMCFLLGSLKPGLRNELEKLKSISSAPQFREAVSGVYFRRTREDVLGELPGLTDTEDWTELTADDRNIYRSAVYEGNFMAMRQVSWQTDDIFASAKAKRLVEICEEVQKEGRKAIVFSFFINTVNRVCKILGERCIGPITGSVPPARRQELVDEFTAAENGAVLVAQIQAGGTGLNIQSASVVIICEPQIKPSVEFQAISRAYRMGQVRNVLVYRLLCPDCVDERITVLLSEKQKLFDNFADESVSGEESLKLSEQNISDIVEAEKKAVMTEEINTKTEK